MSNLARSVGVGELDCPMVSQFDAELVSVTVSNKSAMENAKDYYKRHGPMTTAGSFGSELRALSNSVAEVCKVIQGDLIHRDLTAWLYDVKLSKEQMDAVNLRSFTEMLGKVRTLDDCPLTAAREPNLIWGGVCERYPKLRFAFLESGGGWMAPWLDRMDRHYFDKGFFNDSPLKMAPSEYFRRQCWISFEPVEGSLSHLVD